MGDFSATWLALREPVDARSRSCRVAQALRAGIVAQRPVRVLDIGCGAGANLRATAPFLEGEQDWTLVDNDAALLEHARRSLQAWADHATDAADRLVLQKGECAIVVRFRLANLAACAVDPGDAHLVTASAFFDLASPAFIAATVAATVARRAAFHTVLTYDGELSWSPVSAADPRVRDAFNAHQRRDKGLGPAAGPDATNLLAEGFAAAGYRVERDDSPWHVGPGDAALMQQLNEGIAAAAGETGLVDAATLAAWTACRRTGVSVGHQDLLALPPG